MLLSFSADFSYPNINTYLTSYMRNNATNGYNNDLTYDDWVFLTTTKVVVQGGSMPFIGVLCRKIGCRMSIFIGSAIYSIGFMLTYFTVQSYFPLAILTLAAHGLAFCFVYATSIGAAQKWFPKSQKGFIGSIVLSGYGYGSLIWFPLQTAFVNPNNVKAECDDQACKNRYYKDPDMLDRIPGMFLLLGGIFAICGIIGTILISEPDEETVEALEIEEVLDEAPWRIQKEKEEERNLKPTEVLRTVIFYQMWIGFFSIGLCNGLMSTYSKAFGLTFINDDHFYATVATVQNIFNGSCRILWGFCYDKFGFKACLLSIAIAVTIITSSLPGFPYIGEDTIEAKVGYGTVMVLLYAVFPGIYAILAAGNNDAFGSYDYKANFGLLFTQAVVSSFTIIMMTKLQIYVCRN